MRRPNASDSAAHLREYDDGNLEGLPGLADWLLGEVASGAADVDHDVRRGNPSRGKVIQLLKALRAWEQRRAIEQPTEKSLQKAGQSAAP